MAFCFLLRLRGRAGGGTQGARSLIKFHLGDSALSLFLGNGKKNAMAMLAVVRRATKHGGVFLNFKNLTGHFRNKTRRAPEQEQTFCFSHPPHQNTIWARGAMISSHFISSVAKVLAIMTSQMSHFAFHIWRMTCTPPS